MQRWCVVLLAAVLAACGRAAETTSPSAPTTAAPTVVGGATSSSAPPVTSATSVEAGRVYDTVVLLGDSLLWEATPYLLPLLGDREVVQLPFSWSAVCDGLDLLPPVDPSTLVVVSYTGNSMTACMVDDDGSLLAGVEVVDRYRLDAAELVRRVRADGATVLLLGQPMRGERYGGNEIVAGLNVVYETLAGFSGVHYADAGAALENPDGSFAATLPCLPGEESCGTDGRNPLRSVDELHLCPGQLELAPCPVYSSGAYRFALAIAAAIDSI